MRISARITGLQQVRNDLAALSGRLRNLRPFYLRAGLVPLRAAQQRIDAAGPGWPPAKHPPKYGRLLYRTGALYRSLTIGASGNFVEELPNGIRVGTGLKTPNGQYNIGYLQQYGTRRGIPPRKFLFIDEPTASTIRQLAVTYMRGEE